MNKVLLNERIEKYGTDPILDEEAIYLLTGIPISKIRRWINDIGLKELSKFCDSVDLSSNQKKRLKLLYSFNERLERSAVKERQYLTSSQQAGEFCTHLLANKRKEEFVILLLDAQNRLIRVKKISEGTVNEAVVYPREVMQEVINNNATSVILAHNHPGGSEKPSMQDLEVTNKLVSALATISVKVIDHIIVYEGKYTSMAENGQIGSKNHDIN